MWHFLLPQISPGASPKEMEGNYNLTTGCHPDGVCRGSGPLPPTTIVRRGGRITTCHQPTTGNLRRELDWGFTVDIS